MARVSPSERHFLKNEINEDPFFLIHNILGYKDTTDLHRELIDFVVKHLKSGINLLELLILMPRGHFKTSVVTIGLSIWLILKYLDQSIRININNKILGNARKFLKEIRDHFETNTNLLELYGDLRGKIWQQDQIEIIRRGRIAKEPTIQIGAPGHEATGGHFDYIFNDDLVGLKDMVSEAERRNTENFYRSNRFLVDKKSNTPTINVGTRWHLSDLYDYISKRIDKKYQFIRRAILPNGRPLFPELWTIEELYQSRKEDLIMFSAQMMNEPIPLETQLFKFDELKFFDISTFNHNAFNYVNYSDFAMSQSDQNDFTANITIAYDKTDIFVVDAYIERLTPDENMKRIKEVVEKYNVRLIGAEANVFQSLYADKLEQYLGRSVKKIKHLKDKTLRINAVHPTIIKEVYFRKDWEGIYPRLIEQLVRFPEAKHDDGPDALESAISMIRKHNKLKVWDQKSQARAGDRPIDQIRERQRERLRVVDKISAKKEER